MPPPNINQGTSFDQSRWLIGGHVYNVAGDLVFPSENAPKFFTPRQTRQDELLARHQLFGGRNSELEQLDSLLQHSSNVFHFVYGPSGFGKTALLANWLKTLQSQGQAVCYQFINRLEGMADEEFALRNLCEQLAAWHRILDELPASVEDLRAAYVKLSKLAPPEEKSLVVIIDGLDEAKGWVPGRNLFPVSVAAGAHIFFSARVDDDESRDQWLAQLGLSRDRIDSLRLGRLQPSAIASLLAKAGEKAAELSKNSAFIQALFEVSAGDPFYLQFLVKDIESGKLMPGTLSGEPQDLQAYLAQWQSQLLEDVDTRRDEVYALLGLLTAALGPVKPSDLSGASPLLKKGMLLERELSGNLRRYLSGNRTSGYALCHPRFREFLCNNAFNAEELADYRRQLLEHCRRWREHLSGYALNYYVAHLSEDNHREEIYSTISKDWKEARTRQAGSPRAFAGDVEIAITTALAESPPNLLEALRCCVAYANIASFVERMPVELLAVLTRLGHIEAGRDYALMIRDPGRRSEAYNAIGRALETGVNKAAAAEMFGMALASTERISDAKARASILLKLGEALQRVEAQELLGRAVAAIEATVEELADTESLEAAAQFFTRAGEIEKASEFEARARTAQAEKSRSSFDWSGMDFSGWFPATSASAKLDAEIARACAEADSLLEQDRRADAVAALIAGQEKLLASPRDLAELTYRADNWRRLAEAFGRAGAGAQAKACALRAFEQAQHSPQRGGGFLMDSKPQLLIRVARTFATLDLAETAEQAAATALSYCQPSEISSVRADLAKLSGLFCDLNRAAAAERITERVIHLNESAGDSSHYVPVLAGLAAAAARKDQAQEALALTEQALAGADSLDDSLHKVKILGSIAMTRALANPQETLADVEQRVDQLSELNKALGLAFLAAGDAQLGKHDHALARVTKFVALIEPVDNTVKADIVLEAAQSMIACGHQGWAAKSAQNLLALTSGSGTREVQARLLGDIALTLAQSGDTENALKHAVDAFERSISYSLGFLQDHLVQACALLCSLNDGEKAHALLAAACDTLATMKRDAWEFYSSFPVAALAAAGSADARALERLSDMARDLEGARAQFPCWSALSLALSLGHRDREAQQFAVRALELALKPGQDIYLIRDHLGRLAEALTRTNDTPSLKRLREWIFTVDSYHQGELFQALLPVLGSISDRASIDEILAHSFDLRAFNRSIFCAIASSVLLDMGDRDGAVEKARDALKAFEEERDGSVTPAVLPHLVPALVAIGDIAGLMGLLNMPGDKWPYTREWDPALRLLLPALAKLGVDEPSREAWEKLSHQQTSFSEAQSNIAEAEAHRGLLDKAAATAGEIKWARWRAQAFFRIAQVLTEKGDRQAAEEKLLAASANFPAIYNDMTLLGNMAVLAAKIDAAPRLRHGLKQAFRRTTEVNLIAIDANVFTAAVRPLAILGHDETLNRASAVVDATSDPVAKARCGAALLLALAQAGRMSGIDERSKRTAEAIEQLADVTLKALPLCNMAKALELRGRHDEARDTFLQALNAARHSGRDSLLEILQDGAAIAVAPETRAPEIAEAIRAADSIWG